MSTLSKRLSVIRKDNLETVSLFSFESLAVFTKSSRMGGVRHRAVFKVIEPKNLLLSRLSPTKPSTMAMLGTNPQNMYRNHTKTSCRRNALLNSHTMIAGAYEPTKAYQRGSSLYSAGYAASKKPWINIRARSTARQAQKKQTHDSRSKHSLQWNSSPTTAVLIKLLETPK